MTLSLNEISVQGGMAPCSKTQGASSGWRGKMSSRGLCVGVAARILAQNVSPRPFVRSVHSICRNPKTLFPSRGPIGKFI